jgi:hypothetical protein
MGDLQKKLYEKYLEIQNIDPTGLFLQIVDEKKKILIRFFLAGFNTAKLFADYQYLMKIWTVRFLVENYLEINLICLASMVITTIFY